MRTIRCDSCDKLYDYGYSGIKRFRVLKIIDFLRCPHCGAWRTKWGEATANEKHCDLCGIPASVCGNRMIRVENKLVCISCFNRLSYQNNHKKDKMFHNLENGEPASKQNNPKE